MFFRKLKRIMNCNYIVVRKTFYIYKNLYKNKNCLFLFFEDELLSVTFETQKTKFNEKFFTAVNFFIVNFFC